MSDQGKKFDDKNMILTPVFRVSFPSVFARSEMSGKYELSAIFDEDGECDLALLKAAASKAAAEKWGDKIPKGLRSPFRDGDEKDLDKYPDYAGNTWMTLRTDKRPRVFNAGGGLLEDEGDLYGGCYCRATVSCYAYDFQGNRGVSFGLLGLKKIRDGEAFGGGGGVSKAEDFDGMNDDYDADANETPF